MNYSVNLLIDKFGGIKQLAKALNKNSATIYRWNQPKAKGGLAGIAPSTATTLINKAATELGIDLSNNTQHISSSNPQTHQFINWFRQTAPYIHAHRGKTFVICFGGEAVESTSFDNLIQDIALLHSLGIRLIITHGIRPQLNQQLQKAKHKTAFHEHLRVTDKKTLGLAKQAAGSVRIDIEAKLSASLANSSLANKAVRISSGNFITAKPLGIIDGIDFQHTGGIRRVDTNDISKRLDGGHVVLISPIAYSPTGEVFNLRCEEIATIIASKMSADKLILLTEGTDLTETNQQHIEHLTTSQAIALAAQTPENNDAQLHLQEAIQASQSGVNRVHLINRQLNGGLLIELFTRQGAGTLISTQPFEDARPANLDDIQGILDLIKPLEQRGLLIARTSESIELDIDKFHVIEQDGLITTCAALYSYPETNIGELACVAVHPNYRTGERGKHLLRLIEKEALSQGLTRLFVLTTQSSHWFLERGFSPASVTDLPPEKAANYSQSRRSKILIKKLKEASF